MIQVTREIFLTYDLPPYEVIWSDAIDKAGKETIRTMPTLLSGYASQFLPVNLKNRPI